ncbi:MAG: cyclic nucleotide-binding domain-containing protein [Chloroflexi bacterium]|nr:cyclic nucleotide-binding domain-containing protein [Chloroflexota bacterium]
MQDTHRLASVSAFAALSPQQLRLVAGALKQESYHAGQDIFAQGSPAESMIILLAGEAVLFRTNADGSQTPLATVSPGQILNQEALFSSAIQSATLRAAQPSSVYELARADLQRLLVEEPELRSAIGADKGARRADINPQFAEQRADEEILIQTHRHWWSFARRAWLPLLLMLALSFGATQLEAPAAALVAFGLSFLLPGLALLYAYVEWRNDSVIVTDQRIIRINRTILALYRQVTQVGMESVHEVNFEFPSTDPFARLFRYGTVIVKTAGAQGNLELDFMPNPEQFQKLIIEDRQYFESRQAQRHHKIVREELQRAMASDAADDAEAATADPDAAPRPIPGTNGYLSSRILMSNGDIVYRKHVSVWAKHTVLPLIIVLASVTALLLSATLVSPDLRIVALPASFVALLVGCLAYYWMDWDWRNDLYIISDDTITLVHKRPFFLQSLRDQILVERIDNVESVTSGFLAALLKYGDVRMSLVGADEPKMFHRVSNPREIQQEISRRQHNRAERRAKVDARQQRQILDEYLGSVNGGGADVLRRAAAAAEADLNDGGTRATSNADRNRPPRLPRKVLAAAKPNGPASAASINSASSRRPRRLRADGRARDPS